MKKNRPVFLDLWRIRLPIGGLVSILHRVSGVLMILAIPYGASLLSLSLSDQAGFEAAAEQLGTPFARAVLLLLAWSLIHHLFAGVRFLLLDLGIGLERPAARRSAWTVLSAALAVVLVGGGLLL